jgi:hypothetical protein
MFFFVSIGGLRYYDNIFDNIIAEGYYRDMKVSLEELITTPSNSALPERDFFFILGMSLHLGEINGTLIVIRRLRKRLVIQWWCCHQDNFEPRRRCEVSIEKVFLDRSFLIHGNQGRERR